MRLQDRPRFRASASVRFAARRASCAGAEAVRAIAQSGLTPRTAGCSTRWRLPTPAPRTATPRSWCSASSRPTTRLDASMARALELCRDGGGATPEGAGRTRSGRRRRARGRRRRLAQRLPERALPARRARARRRDLRDLRDRDHLGPLRGVPRRGACTATRDARAARLRQRAASPAASRTSTPTARRPTTPCSRRAGAAASSSSGRRSRRRRARRCCAGGGTITHHHAVGRDHRPWYDRERPDAFARALRAAKRELDPAGVLNPGVLLG